MAHEDPKLTMGERGPWVPHPAEGVRPTDMSRPDLEHHPEARDGALLSQARYRVSWALRQGRLDALLPEALRLLAEKSHG